jgi:serine/threonine protein kinase
MEIGKFINKGVDGSVFEYKYNKAIKFSLGNPSNEVLDYIILNKPDTYVSVYEYGIHEGKHFHIMERLTPLSEDENRVFHSILSHEDRNLKKDFDPDILIKILIGLAKGLDFNPHKVTLFCDNYKTVPIIHGDLHPRNIMRDWMGYFKLIDLNRATLKGKL